MNLTANSKNKLMQTLAKWDVPKDFAEPMYNYLVYGYSPGSCFTAVLANDFARAIMNSHPSNTVNSFKSLAGWIYDSVPKEAHGSYKAVSEWCYLKPNQRRIILEQTGSIYSKEEEVMLVLKDEHIAEPLLY